MKRTILILLPALLWFVNTGWSQSSRLESGAEFGGGIRWLTGTNSNGSAFSPIAGISLLYKFTDNLGLRTGMDYQRKGNRIGDSEYFTNLDYMSFPVCFTIMTDRNTKIYLHSGIYLAYMLLGSQSFRKYEITGNCKRFDIGYCFEPGVAVPLGNDYKFSVGLRYSQGIFNISDLPFQNILTNSIVMVIGFSTIP